MFVWMICLVKRHAWYTWHDQKIHRQRTICQRCGQEKTKLFDADMNPNFFG